MPWRIKVGTKQGEERVFESYDSAKLTPEQKLLWDTVMGEQEKITKTRVVFLMQVKLDEKGRPVSPYLRKPSTKS